MNAKPRIAVDREERERLTITLPNKSAAHEKAVHRILTRLRTSSKRWRITGYTCSDLMFNGFWWNDAGPNRQWVHDKNSLLYIDFKVEHHQSLPLSDIYGEILQMCFQSYKVKKAPQIEIWMTRERIERVLIADQDTIDPEEKAAEDVGDGETKNAYVNSRNNATAPLSTE